MSAAQEAELSAYVIANLSEIVWQPSVDTSIPGIKSAEIDSVVVTSCEQQEGWVIRPTNFAWLSEWSGTIATEGDTRDSEWSNIEEGALHWEVPLPVIQDGERIGTAIRIWRQAATGGRTLIKATGTLYHDRGLGKQWADKLAPPTTPTEVGDPCSRCGTVFEKCTEQIIETYLGHCCARCGYTDTHNVRKAEPKPVLTSRDLAVQAGAAALREEWVTLLQALNMHEAFAAAALNAARDHLSKDESDVLQLRARLAEALTTIENVRDFADGIEAGTTAFMNEYADALHGIGGRSRSHISGETAALVVQQRSEITQKLRATLEGSTS